MIVYMDANILQYVADYEDFVFGLIYGYDGPVPSQDPGFVKELEALQTFFYWEQLGDGWLYPATPSLLKELRERKPGQRLTRAQEELYGVFHTAWQDNGNEDFPLDEEEVDLAEKKLEPIGLKAADRRRIAEAVVLGAHFFLTNDKQMVSKCGRAGLRFRVCLPSEALGMISRGLFWEFRTP